MTGPYPVKGSTVLPFDVCNVHGCRSGYFKTLVSWSVKPKTLKTYFVFVKTYIFQRWQRQVTPTYVETKLLIHVLYSS